MLYLRIAAVYFWPWVLHAAACVALASVALARFDEGPYVVGFLGWVTVLAFGPVFVLYPIAQYVLCHHPDRRTSSQAVAQGPGVFALLCVVWWIALTLGSFGFLWFLVVLGGLPLMIVYVGIGTALVRRSARWYALLESDTSTDMRAQ